MTASDLDHDTSNTIASENDDLRHDEHSSDIRDGDKNTRGEKSVPRHGPDNIADANKELREDLRSDDAQDGEEYIGEPLADKSDMTAPMHDSGDPANDAHKVPGVDPDKIDIMRDESQQEIDLTEGRLRDVTLTQGQSVVDAEFDDRGPATHTHPVDER